MYTYIFGGGGGGSAVVQCFFLGGFVDGELPQLFARPELILPFVCATSRFSSKRAVTKEAGSSAPLRACRVSGTCLVNRRGFIFDGCVSPA